jgi:hypothetical protein
MAEKINKSFVCYMRFVCGEVLYVYSLYGIPKGVEQDVARHEVHMHSVNRLQDVYFKNGGIYIKIGHHIGQLVHLLRVLELW